MSPNKGCVCRTWPKGANSEGSLSLKLVNIESLAWAVKSLIQFSQNWRVVKRQSHKMVKHTLTIRQQKPTNCLSVFDHFVGLTLETKG